MRTGPNWKLKVFAGALSLGMFAAFSMPAQAEVGIRIGRTPPPIRYERRPPAPGPGYAWVDGYWGVNRGRYVWVRGRWDRPPYEGAYWNHAHYDHYNDGWHLHEGHWDREDHGDHYYDNRNGDNRGNENRGNDNRGGDQQNNQR